jgi:perosamine synthetase
VHLALCALDLKRGDKVICPVNAYVDIPEAIRYFDSEPLFIDIDPKSYHIDIDALEQKLAGFKGKKLKAIVVSHFAGMPMQMQRVIELARKYKVAVIEDFIDAPTLEKSIGIAGDIALFSLNYRLDNTIKGAMLAFKEPKHYERAKLLREHGLVETNRDVHYLYDIVDIGCDYRLDAISAYFLNSLSSQREKLVEQRREIVEYYFRELEGVEHIELPIKSSEHIYNYFIIKIDKNRDAFARELKERGVAVGLHYIPLNFTTYYKEKYGLKIFNFPNALHVYQTVMSLPCHSKMSQEDAEYVVRMVKEVAKKHI